MAQAISPGKQDDEQVNVIIAREEDELSGEKGRVAIAIWPKSPNPAYKALKGMPLSAASLLDLGDFEPYHTSFCL